MIPGESVHSMLPWDIPWWRPDHAIFFGVLYAVIVILGSGVGLVVIRSVVQTVQDRLSGRHANE